MDVFTTKWISPHSFKDTLSRQLPPTIEVFGVYQIAPTLPSLQSQVRYSEYRVNVESEREAKDIESAISSLLSLERLPWHHQRDSGQRDYDLRTLIDDLRLVDWRSPYCTIEMRLRCDSSGSGRPEQVTLALNFTHHPQSIHRTRLILETNN